MKRVAMMLKKFVGTWMHGKGCVNEFVDGKDALRSDAIGLRKKNQIWKSLDGN